jgi:hypothetical protein
MAKTGSGGTEPLGGGGENLEVVNDVPISEEVIWKARAEEAEEKVAQLEARVGELESALASANESVSAVERRGQIDLELVAAKAIDLETARLLTEATIAEMDSPDVAVAVRELCVRKPFLFACKKPSMHQGVSMGPAMVRGGDDELEMMASNARSSGDRSELLRYLRVRRGQ